MNVLLLSFNQHGYVSLSLGYLKAYALKDEGADAMYSIETMDFCVDCNDVAQIVYYFAKMNPDVIGLSVYCWSGEKMSDLARLTRQVRPDTKIVAGGPEVGPVAEQWLAENPAVDVVVRGEGEATFAELLRHYATGQGRLWEIEGITYQGKEGPRSTPDRALIDPLDEIPSPWLTGAIALRDHATYLETYRGCPYNCAYCYEGKDYPKLRHFSEERTKAEIELIARSPEVQSFSFIDPVFNLKKDKTKALAKMLHLTRVNNTWLHTVEVMTELIDEETARLLKEAGVVSVETGPQSGNEVSLECVNRYFDREKFTEGIRLLKVQGIHVLCDLMIGLPEDNMFRFADSVRFIAGLRPTTLVFSTLHVLPGTALRDRAAEFGLEYDRKPPHYVLATGSFPYEQVRKAEILAESLSREYNVPE